MLLDHLILPKLQSLARLGKKAPSTWLLYQKPPHKSHPMCRPSNHSHQLLWLLKIGKKFSELASSIKFIEFNDASFAHNNQWLLTASPKQKLQLWQVKDGALLGEWHAFKHKDKYRASVLTIKLINPTELVTISSDGVYEVWAIKAMEKS